MSSANLPKIGEWYKSQTGNKFEIVALDEEDDSIEIQHFDGTLEEFDVDSWIDQEFVSIEAPEDWSGSYDIQTEDYGVDLESQSHIDRSNPLDKIDQ